MKGLASTEFVEFVEKAHGEDDPLSTPALDRSRLCELTDGDAEFQRELIDLYKSSTTTILAGLRASLSAGDADGMAREAHSLKGASLSVGALSMAKCAAEIESSGRAGDASRAREQLAELTIEEKALWLELEQF